jgi:nitrogen fixation/metabolism regulation signal transduction histidine kinase
MRLTGRKTAEEKTIEEEVGKGFLELQKKAMVLLSTEKPVGNKETARLMKELDNLGEGVAEKVENIHKSILKEIEIHSKKTSDMNKWSYGVFTFLGVISLLGIVMIYILINRGITKPLSGLIDAVKIISEGNLDYRIKIETGDEIEMLGKEFNSMTHSLKEKIDEVKEYSEKLKKQIFGLIKTYYNSIPFIISVRSLQQLLKWKDF